MWRNYLALGALFSFSPTPALADVVNVTVNGLLEGSGSIVALCANPAGCGFGVGYEEADLEPFTLATESNDQLGIVSESGVTTAAQRVTFSGSVQQTISASPTSISLDLQTSASVDALGGDWSAPFHLVNDLTLGWTLTTESLMHLTMQLPDFAVFPCFVEAPDFFASCPTSTTLDQLLGPGSYTLLAADELGPGFGPYLTPSQDELSENLSLTADFTTVPEPRWAISVLAALFSLWASALHQMRESP